MPAAKGRRNRARGAVEALPSGSLRVCVYAGIDPVTHERHYLEEVSPAGPKAQTEAEKVLTRFLNQIDECRIRGRGRPYGAVKLDRREAVQLC